MTLTAALGRRASIVVGEAQAHRIHAGIESRSISWNQGFLVSGGFRKDQLHDRIVEAERIRNVGGKLILTIVLIVGTVNAVFGPEKTTTYQERAVYGE
jgi:hypothetical protein